MADGVPSRYRSQRLAQPKREDVSSSPLAADDENLARSKSRYRRNQGNLADPSSEPDNRPASDHQPQQDKPSRYHSVHAHRQQPLNTLYAEKIVETRPPNRRANSSSERQERLHSATRDQRRVNNDDNDGIEGHRIPSRKQNSQQRHPPTSSSHGSPPPAQPSGELFPPPRPTAPPKLDGPPQSGNIRATKSMSELPKYEEDASTGCFGGLFQRKKAEPNGSIPNARPKTPKTPKTPKPEALPIIMQGGVPGKDAPVSAINAGDRRVLIECGKSRTFFPVTPTTTPVDLIKSAATCMSERVNVKSAVLLECFSTVGVQRPLRRYEHIRDVMNSWDNDKQNSLILVDPGIGTVEQELTITGAPTVEPDEQSWCLSYSQKVGKWEKRFITLRPSGQIICQKDPEKPRDVVNVCHLSDFDIYTPTPEKAKKKIKPPKKLCYAIKSQQKTSLFESTENFVHFFSTGDREIADSFYNAVQGWRSWYLVNVLGEGQILKENSDRKLATSSATDLRARSSSNDRSRNHRVKGSTDSHYQLGSFKPLIDMNQFDQRNSSGPSDHDLPGSSNGVIKSANQFDVNASLERRTSAAKRKYPPVSLKKTQLAEDEPLANLNRQRSVSKRRSSTEQRSPESSEFRDAGLLGRSYSQRRKDQSEAQQEGPFTQGPSLLNRVPSQNRNDLRRQSSTRKQASGTGDLQRSSSTRGGQNRGNSVDLERSGTRRQKPKPLIDLTPEYREPPQHAKKGRGYQPEQINAGGLIADATSPEDPLGIPQNNIFRNTNAMPEGRRRAGSSSRPGQAQGHLSNSRPAEEAFTGEGLLASHKEGWGTGTKGRGVIDGSHAAGRPLVDLSHGSRFAGGSLLASVERADPIAAPIIDREKREERVEKYGEGY